jgi:hypothetical protein
MVLHKEANVCVCVLLNFTTGRAKIVRNDSELALDLHRMTLNHSISIEQAPKSDALKNYYNGDTRFCLMRGRANARLLSLKQQSRDSDFN